VKLLLLRGETNVRILDIVPPSSTLSEDHRVTFIKTDMTSLESVRAGLTKPFTSTKKPPSVIYHTAASIRFYERFSYCWDASYNVNVKGTQNILTVVSQELPGAIVVYTSSGNAVIPRMKYMRLGLDVPGGVNHRVVVSDEDPPLAASSVSQSCYARSKIMAEKLVKEAHGKNGIRTGILRPGQYVLLFTVQIRRSARQTSLFL
jgi:nucleoside-diphosphate-sugar epimerase